MKTIVAIIETKYKSIQTFLEEPGQHIKILNEPYMPLSIESIGKGPNGYPALSVCHYGNQNGDPMRDPDMEFEVYEQTGKPSVFLPYSYRNDYLGKEDRVYQKNGDCLFKNMRMESSLKAFMKTWDQNLKDQGFIEAAQKEATQ